MKNPFKSRNHQNLISYFILAVAVIIAYLLISNIQYFLDAVGWLWYVIRPFFYGFIIAYIINIPFSGLYNLLSKIKFKFMKRVAKSAALVITLSLTIFAIYLVFYFILPQVFSSVSLFIYNLPRFYQEIQELIDSANFEIVGIQINLDNIYTSLGNMLLNLEPDDFESSISAILAVPTAIYTAIIAIVASIFLLIEKDKLISFIKRVVGVFTPSSVNDKIIGIMSKLNKNFKKYLYVQSLYSLICGVTSTIALVFLGSPYFAILGLILGLCNYIPYVGSIVATVIAVLVVWFSQGFTMAIIATLVIFILQQLGANILYPKLMGHSFKLSPLLVLVSITIGGALSGIFGMIVAIPFAVVIKDIVNDVIGHVEVRRSKTLERKYEGNKENDDMLDIESIDNEDMLDIASKESDNTLDTESIDNDDIFDIENKAKNSEDI